MTRLLQVVGWFCAGVLLLLLALSGVLAFMRVRTVTLPRPRGPYAVGRLISEWTDSAREEPLGPQGGRRRLSVWIWYPAQGGGRPAPYLPPAWARALRQQRTMPLGLLFQATSSIRPHAREGAPAAAVGAPFPVLIFEPGIYGSAFSLTSVAEDLASRGYVVVGLNPTYSSALTLLDGARVPLSAAGRLPDAREPRDQYARDAARLLAVWAADDRFAMDRLTRLAAEAGPLGGALDVKAFGLWGHSFGGAAAWRACRLDARCAGAANLDGDLFGAVASVGTPRPVLFLGNGMRAHSLKPEIAEVLSRSPHGVMRVLPGARHGDFADPVLEPVRTLPPLRRFWGLGSIEGARVHGWAADELDAFFSRVLRRARTSPRARA